MRKSLSFQRPNPLGHLEEVWCSSCPVPATFAHPAFAWPLRRLGCPWLALVVGSVVPDIAHLLPRSTWLDHTVVSLVVFSLPAGLVGYAAVRWMLLPPLLLALPRPLQARWSWPLHAPANLSSVPLAIFLGAASHVGIDHCTHRYGAMVQTFSFLQFPVVTMPLYKILQYGGGVGGTWFLLRKSRLTGSDFSGLTTKLAWTAFPALSAALLYGYLQSWWLTPVRTRFQVFAVSAVLAAMSFLFAEWVVFALTFWILRWKQRLSQAPTPPPQPDSLSRNEAE